MEEEDRWEKEIEGGRKGDSGRRRQMGKGDRGGKRG